MEKENTLIISEDEKKEKTPKSVWKRFLDYLVVTSGGMALGLFATLIVGSVIGTIAGFLPSGFITTGITNIANVLKSLMGIGIGLGVGLSLKNLRPIQLISSGVAGAIAGAIPNSFVSYLSPLGFDITKVGNPLLIYIVVLCSIELVKLILKKPTPVDIIAVPLLFVFISSIITYALSVPINISIVALSKFISDAVEFQPFWSGLIISTVMGMVLTAPISSVALAYMVGLQGVAAGAAVVGCSVQMIGFMMMSIHDNSVGKVISVGIGTSMLQFKNILKKPIIWLPTIIVSAILGPIATMVLHLECSTAGAGMGTCSLVGQIGTIDAMGVSSWQAWVGILALETIGPAILVFAIDLLFRRFKLIKKGDLTL